MDSNIALYRNCTVLNFACWVIFHFFFVVCWLFFHFLEKFFRENHQGIKQFGSRSERMIRLSWSASKLLHEEVSAYDKCPH